RWIDVSVSPSLLRLLLRYIRWADVVHLMAVYSFPTIPTLALCRLIQKPVVWSPRGMFQRWQGTRKQTMKSAWDSLCKLISPKTAVLHFTSNQEAEESAPRMRGFDSVIIPNSLEIPDSVSKIPHSTFRFLYLGRLDEKKGIENLIDAFALMNGR